jgi:hypothetical protein
MLYIQLSERNKFHCKIISEFPLVLHQIRVQICENSESYGATPTKASALGAGRPLSPGRILVLISVTGWVDPRAIVRLEGLGKLKKKNPMTSSGIEPATFQLVA